MGRCSSDRRETEQYKFLCVFLFQWISAEEHRERGDCDGGTGKNRLPSDWTWSVRWMQRHRSRRDERRKKGKQREELRSLAVGMASTAVVAVLWIMDAECEGNIAFMIERIMTR